MTATSGKIEVSLELAKELVPILKDQIKDLDNQAVSILAERDSKARTLAELEAKLNGETATTADGVRKRMRKGQADKIVFDFLKTLLPNQSARIQEIVQRTGVSYSSTFRVLKDKNKGRFVENDGWWSLAKK